MACFRHILSLPIAISLAFGAVPARAAEPDAAAMAAFTELQQLDSKLLETGHRLAVANAGHCRDTEMVAGMSFHDLAQYRDRDTARAVFGFPSEIAVLAVANGSPSEAAGVEPDNGLAAINGTPPIAAAETPEKWNDEESIDRLASVQGQWRSALAAGQVTVSLSDAGGGVRTVQIVPVKACRSRFQLVPSTKFEASADGDLVTISTRMMRYVAGDDELAAVVAHEFAHNILRHLQRLEAAGHTDGLFGAFGRSARLTKQTEIEADRLSVWLMANAGYDPMGAVTFWRRYGKERGKGIFSAPTHYRYKKRVKLFEEEIAKMRAMERGPDGYAPPLLTAPFAELE